MNLNGIKINQQAIIEKGKERKRKNIVHHSDSLENRVCSHSLAKGTGSDSKAETFLCHILSHHNHYWKL